MKNRIHLCIAFCLLISMNAMAQQTTLVIDNQIPGMLSDMINEEDQKTVENLKITGYINSTDINFIKTLKKKKTLDLTDVNIIKGGEQIYLYNRYSAGYYYPQYLLITENNVFYSSLFWSFHVDKIVTPKVLKETGSAVRVNADTLILNSRATINIRVGTNSYGYPTYWNRMIEIGEGVDSVGITYNVGTGNASVEELIIPSTLKKFNLGSRVNLKRVVSRIEHPETLNAEDFKINGETLFIPQGTYQRYQNSSVFKDMKVIIEMNAPTSISLSSTDMKLYVSDFEYLYATTTPSNVYYKELKWESSDESVVVVNQYGEVTAVALGTAEIIVSSVQNPEARAKCKVTVCEHVTGIELASAEEIVNIGEPLTLTANTLPLGTTDNEVTWTSSDEEIATVDGNGKVTGIKQGSCTIKATSVDGGYVAECNITVVQPATGISVNKLSASILVGASETFTATVTPNDVTDKTVIWSSSDTDVATVDENGVVTANKAGAAIITATAASNSEVKATCEVTVIQPVTGITLEETSLTIAQLGEMKQLVVKVLPEDASNKKVKWTSSNPVVCTVSENGTVVATGYGTATIVATTEDGGFPAACVVNVSQAITLTAKNSTKVYGDPNPAFEYVTTGEGLNGVPQLTCEATEKSPVGTYPIVIAQGSVTNGNVIYVNSTLTVTKAPLTVTAQNSTRTYGEENPVFELKYAGFVNNEDESVLSALPKATTAATISSDAGEYDITVDGGVADNYDISYVAGKLTVEKANQTLTWDQDFSDVKQYDQVELTATASSGLDVTYTVEGNQICSISNIGDKQYLDCSGEGETVIVAIQEGNKNYLQTTKIYKPITIKSATGIDTLTMDANVKMYDVSGNRISKPQRGINILKMPDGTMKKVVVK